jgi:hypothetical protein
MTQNFFGRLYRDHPVFLSLSKVEAYHAELTVTDIKKIGVNNASRASQKFISLKIMDLWTHYPSEFR